MCPLGLFFSLSFCVCISFTLCYYAFLFLLLTLTQLQTLIPSKCPGAPDKVKVTSMSDPSPARQKQEMDTVVR